MSIKLKLILLVAITTTLPSALVGLLAYQLSHSALEEKISDDFSARRELIANELSHHLADLNKNAEAWVAAPAMADVKISDTDSHIQTFITNTGKAYSIVKAFTVLDAKKKVIATTNADFLDALQVAPDKLTKDMATPISAFDIDRVLKGESLGLIGAQDSKNYLAVPIKDVVAKDGSVVGVLFCEINRKILTAAVNKANEGKDNNEKVNIYLTVDGSEVASLNEKSIDVPYEKLVQESKDIPEGTSQRTVGGASVVLSSGLLGQSLPGMSPHQSVTILQPESIAFAPVRQLALYVFLVSILLVSVFLVAGAVFARRLSKPILDLRGISEDIIRSGDLTKRVADGGSDEIGSLSRSFNSLLEMVEQSQAKLEEYSKGLEIKVNERTKAIRTILDHVSFGLFVADEHLKINEGYSASTMAIFGCDQDNLTGTFLPTLLGCNPRFTDHFNTLYNQIFDPEMLLGDIAVDQLPNRFVMGERTVSLTGSVVHDDAGKSNGVLFCVADITNLVKAEEEIERNRGLIKMLGNRDSFRQFVLDMKAGFDATYAALKNKDDAVTRRELHTLKGNSGVFGLASVASTIHHIEDEITITAEQVKSAEDVFVKFLNENQELLGVKYGVANDDSFTVPAKLIEATQTKAIQADSDDLRHVINDFFRLIRLKRARTVIGPIEDALGQLASRLGKQAHLVFEGADTLMPTECMGVLKSINHLLRNALDHGIEFPNERGNKPEAATIRMTIRDQTNHVEIVVEDDGKGIKKAAVAKKALEKGLVTEDKLKKMSDDQICGLIFAQGLSTSAQVSDVSGRGVGMGAVQQEVEAVGGTISVSSKEGLGTKFTIIIPKSNPARGQTKAA